MPVKKGKCMTQKQRKLRCQIRKELQENGAIPQDKPRLNRKKFCEEAIKEWNNRKAGIYWESYLMAAVIIMTSHTDRKMNLSLEAVGAAKCLRLAIRMQEFTSVKMEAGEKGYDYSELHDAIKDILEA